MKKLRNLTYGKVVLSDKFFCFVYFKIVIILYGTYSCVVAEYFVQLCLSYIKLFADII